MVEVEMTGGDNLQDKINAKQGDSTDQTQESGGTTLTDFKEDCFRIRDTLGPLKYKVLALKENLEFKNEQSYPIQHGEMKANIMLAYRHLEDARMRLGKAVQAYDGGESCYPR